MSSIQPHNQDRLHNLLTANMLFGVAACGAAIYFMVTGEYTNLPARQTTEALLKEPLIKLIKRADARRSRVKKRSLHGVNEHFEPGCNTAAAASAT
ncbi:MAG: hypothetical protein KKE76_12405 [Gammaproteobacteria bacterium]|nr:hypothetical protein [Gammaproteobacteria bacterium]